MEPGLLALQVPPLSLTPGPIEQATPLFTVLDFGARQCEHSQAASVDQQVSNGGSCQKKSHWAVRLLKDLPAASSLRPLTFFSPTSLS